MPLGLPAYVLHQTIVVVLAWRICAWGWPLAAELPALAVSSLALTLVAGSAWLRASRAICDVHLTRASTRRPAGRWKGSLTSAR